jgi:hypothetical protein
MEGDWYPTINVQIHPGSFNNISDLMKAVFGSNHPIITEPLGWITVAGQKAIVHILSGLTEEVAVSFVSPDKKNLITVSTLAKHDDSDSSESIVNDLVNEKLFQNILDTFTFSEETRSSTVTRIIDIVKMKAFHKKRNDYNVNLEFIEKVDLPDQARPLYIISSQLPNSLGPNFSNCGRGNNDERVCPTLGYIVSGKTYQQVLAIGLDLKDTVRVSSKRLNNMPCLEITQRREKITYCYDGNQYQPVSGNGR